MNNGLTTYQKAQTEGLSQRDLIVMCYKGAIKYLRDAKSRHEQSDYEGFSDLLEKAHRVIFHLYTTLDMKQGGEIAARLADIYAFVISQIYLVNATKEVAVVDNLIGILDTIRSGWTALDPKSATPRPNQSHNADNHAKKTVSVEI